MKTIKVETFEKIFAYMALVPEKLSDKPALLIQLHGAGERGNGADVEKVLIHGFPQTVNDDNLKDCILVMPQCPDESTWADEVDKIKEFTEIMIKDFSADTDRIYLCGLSMGGYGTWHTATKYPELYTAIAPCCGGGDPKKAASLTMPIWAFHGMLDGAVPVNNTLDMLEVLKDINPNLKYTLYEDIGHSSWVPAFTEPTLEWLLAQKK